MQNSQEERPIELRDWALRILSADILEEKLFSPLHLIDTNPGDPIIWKEPSRPPGMGFKQRTKKEKLPPFHEHHNPDKRAICLHRFAGHELLAVEIMAYALVKFPLAHPLLRKGIARTLKEEQGHVRLYRQQLKRFGLDLGDLPLYRHFWVHTPYLHTPLHYLSVMSLTFEMANLDFAPMYGQSFARQGDLKSAKLMEQILKDEIAHVAFGWHWFKKLKSSLSSDWEAWKGHLSPLLTPKRARGFILHETFRINAGIDPVWIEQLKNY